MPEVYRALIVILVLQGATAVLLRKPIIAMGMAPEDFDRRRNCWFAMVALCFAVPSFWFAMAAVAAVALVGRVRERNPIALYSMLLLAVPLLSDEIPGIGPIQHFARMDHSRVLALVLLLPAAANLLKERQSPRIGHLATDKALLAFYGLLLALNTQVGTPLSIIRAAVVYPILDMLLLYYVASRTLVRPEHFVDFRATLTMTLCLLAVTAAFEFGKGWLLYNALSNHLGAAWDMGAYLLRNDSLLRAMATAGQPIALGFLFLVGSVFAISASSGTSRTHWLTLIAILVTGSISSLSRGPWVATAVAVFAFLALGRSGAKNLVAGLFITGAVGFLMSMTSSGRAALDYLPFVGEVESGNVTYRQQVLDVSIDVILDNPWFGAYDALSDPRMEQLRQGQGIIDIVNTYVGIGLSSGLVGLALFCAVFIIPSCHLLAALRPGALPDEQHAAHARTMLAVLAGVMVALGTTSSITVIPHVYWMLIGTAVATHVRRAATAPIVRTRPLMASPPTARPRRP